MSSYKILIALMLASFTSFLGANESPQASLSNPPESFPDKRIQRLVQSQNEFAISLYQELQKDDLNVFFSPYSISSCLSMVYLGAHNTTADEMKETDFDLFAGGGIMTRNDTTELNRIISELKANGYQIITEIEEYDSTKTYSDKIYYSVFDILGGYQALPYALDYENQ